MGQKLRGLLGLSNSRTFLLRTVLETPDILCLESKPAFIRVHQVRRHILAMLYLRDCVNNCPHVVQ